MTDTPAPRPWRRAQAPSPTSSPTPQPTPALRRAPAPPASALVRLNKRMADLGLASRREADDWIARGWVRVQGRVAQLGDRVSPSDRIEVARPAQQAQAQAVTFLLHKPLGVVSAQAEDGHTPAAALLAAASHWAQDASPRRFEPTQLRGLAPAGRLDVDSTGLLVLTQDGRVARALVGEDAQVEKEYLVRVAWTGRINPLAAQSAQATYAAAPEQTSDQDARAATPASALAQLRHGLHLDGRALQSARVEWANADQLRFVLTEGRKRQIRRMCELVGLKVLGLKRVRIGRVRLGDLPLGQWRYLAGDEWF